MRGWGTYAWMGGNLPEWKKNQHVGYCWCPCPFDTTDRCTDLRTEHLIGVSNPSEGREAHVINGKEYYMEMTTRGGAGWGFECPFPGCPYKKAHGEKYFYV